MELEELKSRCANILLDGNVRIEEDGALTFDVSEEDKLLFVEYAVNMILKDALDILETKVTKDKSKRISKRISTKKNMVS